MPAPSEIEFGGEELGGMVQVLTCGCFADVLPGVVIADNPGRLRLTEMLVMLARDLRKLHPSLEGEIVGAPVDQQTGGFETPSSFVDRRRLSRCQIVTPSRLALNRRGELSSRNRLSET